MSGRCIFLCKLARFGGFFLRDPDMCCQPCDPRVIPSLLFQNLKHDRNLFVSSKFCGFDLYYLNIQNTGLGLLSSKAWNVFGRLPGDRVQLPLRRSLCSGLSAHPVATFPTAPSGPLPTHTPLFLEQSSRKIPLSGQGFGSLRLYSLKDSVSVTFLTCHPLRNGKAPGRSAVPGISGISP